MPFSNSSELEYSPVPSEERDKLIENVPRMMVKNRGFLKLEAFNEYLVALYKNKEQETTVADLYPEIISWFEENNR